MGGLRNHEPRPVDQSSDVRGGGAEVVIELGSLLGLEIGALAWPVVLPLWCRDSLACDAARSGRSVVSIARWAILWPVATVVLLVLPTLVLAAVGQGESFFLLWLVGLAALGALVASRARGLGGFLLGMIGLLVGGALMGVGACVVVVVGGAVGAAMPVGPLEALVYIPLLATLVPTLGATPFGLGLVVASMVATALAALRR